METGLKRGELLLLSLLLAGAFISALAPVWDPDSFWHLAFGRNIIENRALPRTEPFAFSRAGAPVTDLSWLPHVSFYLAYKWFGYPGTEALVSLAALMAALFLAAAVRAEGLRVASLCIYFSLFFTAFSGRFKLRPEAFSLVLFAVLIYLLTLYRRDRLRFPLAFALLFLLWGQVHPSWIYGALLIPLYLLEKHSSRLDRTFFRDAFFMALLPAGALFLNPYGWRPVVFPFTSFMTMRSGAGSTIAEWQRTPVTLSTAPFLTFSLFAVAFTLYMLLKKRDTILPFSVSLLQAMFLIMWVRYSSFAFIALAPIAAKMADALLKRLGRFKKCASPAAALLLLLPASALFRYQPTLALLDRNYPSAESGFIASRKISGNLLHTFVAGGFLEFTAAPACRTFIDGRYFDFLGQIAEYEDARKDIGKFREFSKKYPFEIAVMPYSQVSAPDPETGEKRNVQALLLPAFGWAPVFYGPYGAVYLKREAKFENVIGALEYKVVFPDDSEFTKKLLSTGKADKRQLESELRRAWDSGAAFLRTTTR